VSAAGRAATSLAFAAGLAAAVAAFLVSSPARPPDRIPLFPRGAGWLTAEAPLVEEDGRRRLHLETSDAAGLVGYPEVWLRAAGAAERVRDAELRVVGTACAFRLARDGPPRTLRLVRRPCPTSGVGATGAVVLELRAEGDAPLSLPALAPPEGAAGEPRFLRVTSAPGSSRRLVLRALGVRPAPPTGLTRADLLAYAWQLPGGRGWIFAALAAAGALAVTGAWLLPRGDRSSRPALRAAAAAFCLALALGGAYAVVAPPLSGPDEPSHLGAFAALAGAPRLVEETRTWAAVTHLGRIRYHPEERFRPEDVGRPDAGAAGLEIGIPSVRLRSATAAAAWGTVARGLRGASAPRALLTLRLAHALAFAAAVAAASAISVAWAAADAPQLLCLPYLLVPALPFFAVSLSDVALTMSAYVVLAASTVVVLLDGPRASAAGLPLGLACGVMLAGGRSAWPLAAAPLALGTARVVLGPREGGRRATLLFWGGFAAGASVFLLLADGVYRAGLAGQRVAALAPLALGPLAQWVASAPAAPLALAPVAAALELALVPARRRVAALAAGRSALVVRRAARLAEGGLGASLLLSLVVDFPRLPVLTAHPNPYAAGEYVRLVAAAALTSFRLTAPDFLLARLFWTGFGWFDALPGPALPTALGAATALSAIGLLLRLARHPDARRALWLLALAAGLGASLVLYALAIHGVGVMNATGRYLAGWFLVAAAVAWAWPALALGRLREPSVVLAAPLAIHAGCLCFLLWRYF
jgi:hypothetical protein